MSEAKKSLAASGESKATAEGDLGTTSKKLDADSELLASTKQDCMTKAQDYEAATKSRGEEIAALRKAAEIITESTSGAAAQTYGLNQVSFVQLVRSQLSSTADLAKFEAVRLVRELARKQHSMELQQRA